MVKKRYQSDAILQYMLNWLEPLSSPKLDYKEELFGFAWFPSIEGCYNDRNFSENFDQVKEHYLLIAQLQNQPCGEWTTKVKDTFNSEYKTEFFGSPMLDQKLRKPANAVENLVKILESQSGFLSSDIESTK
jgi:hypothetical protein